MVFAVTAYVAIALAGLNSETWEKVSSCLWIAVMVLAIIVAAGRTSNASVFARGLLLSGVLFFVAATAGNPISQWIIVKLDSVINQNTAITETVRARAYNLTLQNIWFLFGIVCGFLSLWRYKVLDCRAQGPLP